MFSFHILVEAILDSEQLQKKNMGHDKNHNQFEISLSLIII